MLGPMQARDITGTDRLPRVRKTRAVLAILALAAPEPVLRSTLVDLLWSRRDPPQARGSLRQAVRELQLALGPVAGLLRVERTHIALTSNGVWVDARQAIAVATMHPHRPAARQDSLLSDLVGLDPAFDRWLRDERHALAQRMRRAAEADLAQARGPDALMAAAERLLAIDPAHEGAWRAIIRCHAERGDRAAAVAAFERCRAALLDRCQASPGVETTALIDALRGSAPPVAELPPIPVSAPAFRRRPTSRPRVGIASLRGSVTEGTTELAAALTEEMVVALSRFRSLRCRPCEAFQPDQDVDFALGGTVRSNGTRLRVLLRLTDRREGGDVVWAEHFEHDLTDVFVLQDRIASTAAARIEPRLWLWDGERIDPRDITPRTPQDLLRLAVPALHRLDRSGFMAAGTLLDQSVALDPDSASAHAWAAQWYIFCVGQGWAKDAAAGMQRAQDLAEIAIRLDPEDARGLTLAGHVRGFLNRQPDEALRLHERAIAANPNLPLSWCLSGLAHSYVGDFDTAICQVRHARMLSPNDPLDYFHEMALCVAYLLRGDHQIAAEAGKRAITLNPGCSSSHKGYLAAMGHLDPGEGVALSRSALLKLEPGFSVRQAMTRSPITLPAARQLYEEGLRVAGLP